MFCPNCGNQNPDNAACCGQCGTKFATANAGTAQKVNKGPAKSATNTDIISRCLKDSSSKYLIAIAGIGLLTLILWFVETVSFNDFKYAQTLGNACDGTSIEMLCIILTIFAVFTALGTVAFAIIILLLGISDRPYAPIPFYVTGGFSFILMLTNFIFLFIKYSNYRGGVTISPAFTAWLYMLCCIATVLLGLLIFFKNKKK